VRNWFLESTGRFHQSVSVWSAGWPELLPRWRFSLLMVQSDMFSVVELCIYYILEIHRRASIEDILSLLSDIREQAFQSDIFSLRYRTILQYRISDYLIQYQTE
jgi:hypothetical protein